jgi:hypothetical protein
MNPLRTLWGKQAPSVSSYTSATRERSSAKAEAKTESSTGTLQKISKSTITPPPIQARMNILDEVSSHKQPLTFLMTLMGCHRTSIPKPQNLPIPTIPSCPVPAPV